MPVNRYIIQQARINTAFRPANPSATPIPSLRSAMPVPNTWAKTSNLLTYIERASNFVRRYVHFNHWLFALILVLAAVSFWFSYEFRFDLRVPFNFSRQRLLLLPYVAFLKVFVFYLLRGHSTDWRYVGLSDIPTLTCRDLFAAPLSSCYP